MNIQSAGSIATLSMLVLGGIACEKKLSPEAVVAQDATKAAKERLAGLEQQLAELKSGKQTPKEGDRETLDTVSFSLRVVAIVLLRKQTARAR